MGNRSSQNQKSQQFMSNIMNQDDYANEDDSERVEISQQRDAKDDEPLIIVPRVPVHSSTDSPDLEISLRFCRSYLATSSTIQNLPCNLIFKAPENNDLQRSGVDIICVIDVSGSMMGEKLDLVKKTLNFMLTQVTDIDRVSLIEFSDNASKVLPLTIMNHIGKEKAQNAIESLRTIGGTNIIDGLDYGIQTAINRKTENLSTAIILLSDGCDDKPKTALERAKSCIESYNNCSVSYSIHSFGYGKDHDAATLSAIAEIKNGGFYYIEKFENISAAFANCLGELLSAMAIDVEVSLSTQSTILDFSLSKIYSSTGDNQFTLPNIMFGDLKESVFVLTFPENKGRVGETSEIEPVVARVSYTLLSTGQKVNRQEVLRIRVQENEDQEVQIYNDVLINFYRVKTADVLKEAGELGDQGKMAEARSLLQNAANEIKNSEVKAEQLAAILINDLEKAQLKFRDRESYEHGGRAELRSKALGHLNKRGEQIDVYQNVCQKKMQMSSKNYFSG